MRASRPTALGAVLAFVSFPVLAQTDETPPPEPPPTTTTPAPPLSPAELQALQEATAADASSTPATPAPSSLPDLSQVNLGSALPGVVQSMNPDIALLFNGTASWFSVDPPLQTGEHDPDRTGFKLQQIEMQIGASVDPFARFDANIVFKGSEVEVEEAYATTTALPWNLQARAGQFLTHVGRTNEQHPHLWAFVDQPLVYGKIFGPDNNRGLGAELSWLAPLPWFVTTYVAVQDAPGECCSRSFAPRDPLQLETPLDLVGSAVVEQFFPLGDDLAILWGVSGMAGPGVSLDDGVDKGGRAEVFGTDVMVRYAPVASETRWSLTWLTEVFGRTRHDDRAGTDVVVDGGGLTQLVWRVNPQVDVGARFEALQAVDGDPLDPGERGFRTRSSVEGSFYPSHFSRLRLQGSVDVPTWEAAPIYAVMLQLEVAIGAHGAHPY